MIYRLFIAKHLRCYKHVFSWSFVTMIMKDIHQNHSLGVKKINLTFKDGCWSRFPRTETCFKLTVRGRTSPNGNRNGRSQIMWFDDFRSCDQHKSQNGRFQNGKSKWAILLPIFLMDLLSEMVYYERFSSQQICHQGYEISSQKPWKCNKKSNGLVQILDLQFSILD